MRYTSYLPGMISEALGVLVAVIIQGQLVSKYRKSDDCSESGKIPESDIEGEVRDMCGLNSKRDC